jgi:signal transduction histidine kinase/HPt (histidine-containing phosphotransfer) domain-containing protein/FixJ family two-component response regulator
MRVLSTERTILGGFSLALIVLCVVAGVSVRLTLALLADLNEVSDRVKILDKIGQANATLPQMAAAARLYGFNHADETFREWQKYVELFRDQMEEIAELTNDNQAQQARLARALDRLKTKEIATTRDLNQLELYQIWGVTEDGKSAVFPIVVELMEMARDEEALLKGRNDKAARSALAALWTIGLASVLAIFLVAGAVGLIMRDLRARRKAAEELDRARQAAEAASVAKSAFLANMSHELRTPLTSIMGYTYLLLQPDIVNARRQEFLQTMRRSGEHLLNLINDILDVSKIEAGRMTVEMVECRMLDVLADVDSLMRARAIEKGIAFSINYKTSIPDRIRSDPTRLRQILMNLAGNAVKFTDQGSVEVSVSHADTAPEFDKSGSWAGGPPSGIMGASQTITVEFRDSGVGISQEQQKLLFKPFMQADLSTTRRFGGTGLGLSISRRLARMLGGELTVQSRLGMGSTFTLVLPLDPIPGAQMLPPGDARHIATRIGGRNLEPVKRELGVRVLLAEDGVDNRDVIMLHLCHAGCQVFAAEDGQQAFDIALQSMREKNPFDAILMDMQMPVMDGYTATSKLRAAGYTGVIIALTAHAMQEDRDRCLRVGCDEYAPKPIDMPALLGIIARFCGRAGGITVTQTLAADPVLRALTRKFCDGTIETLGRLRQSAQRRNWDELAGIAHKLAGTGGAYGFEEITRHAKALEKSAQARAPLSEVETHLANLQDACENARQHLLGAKEDQYAPIGSTKI